MIKRTNTYINISIIEFWFKNEEMDHSEVVIIPKTMLMVLRALFWCVTLHIQITYVKSSAVKTMLVVYIVECPLLHLTY